MKDKVRQLMMLARSGWSAIRQVSGDDAYERYCRHHAEHHPDELLLTREQFFRQWQDNKWKGVKRCC